MPNLILAASQSRQVLKDALRRIKRIRYTCGDPEYEKELAAESDPLLKCMGNFESNVADAQDMLEVENPLGSDKMRLRKYIVGATQDLKEMESMYEKADALLNTALLKGKKPEKVEPLQEQRNRCKLAFEQANDTFAELMKLQDEKTTAAAANVDANGKKKKKKDEGPQMREPVVSNAVGREKKNMKRAMDILAKSQGIVEEEEQDGDAQSAAEMFESGGLALAQDPSTRGKFGKIQSQKREVQTSLKRISEGVGRLHEMSKIMAAEIEDQGRRIEKLDDIIQNKQQSLLDLNDRVKDLNQSLQPLNTCFNVLCFIILLACVGFLLVHYQVVSIPT